VADLPVGHAHVAPQDGLVEAVEHVFDVRVSFVMEIFEEIANLLGDAEVADDTQIHPILDVLLDFLLAAAFGLAPSVVEDGRVGLHLIVGGAGDGVLEDVVQVGREVAA